MDDSRREHSPEVTRIDGGRTRRKRGDRPSEPLSVCVQRAIDAWFDDLDGEPGSDLYALVLDEVEGPMLETVMARTDGNQSRAAEILGLNRGTLRKKLKQHGLL